MQSIQEAIGPILTAVGGVVVGGSAITAFAFWLFKLFGDRWLTNIFAEKLAAFRHEQAKELEQFKFEIDKLLDRSTKLHGREFDVLPKAWKLLVKSYHTTRGVTSALQTYADVGRMKPEEFEEFLAGLPLKDWQKAELRQASDKNKYYQDAIFWHRLKDARSAARKSAIYQETSGIFMPSGMKDKFDRVETLGWNALVESETNKSYDLRNQTEQDKFNKEGTALFKLLEKEVHERLWSSVATEKPESPSINQ